VIQKQRKRLILHPFVLILDLFIKAFLHKVKKSVFRHHFTRLLQNLVKVFFWVAFFKDFS